MFLPSPLPCFKRRIIFPSRRKETFLGGFFICPPLTEEGSKKK